MKLDIGCGPKCLPGFVGVDRFQMPGVQVIADLNETLPFEDDSVELVHAAHSLEHVADLMFTMKELYRVCKHKAQICIVVPYYEQKLNLANPYHLQVFNEHTPRFWSSCSWAPIDKEEYYHPHAVTWGLSHSDHSDPGLEIRLLRMEFFYFPQFHSMDKARQREARQYLTDVCHQIVYHLVVWKDHDEDDYTHLIDNLDRYPFLDTPALQEARTDADNCQAASFATISYGEKILSQKLSEQRNYIAMCERKLARNEKLLQLLSGELALLDSELSSFDDHLSKTYSSRGHFQLGKTIPDEGYVEYNVDGAGECTSISVCICLSSDAHGAQLGMELVDKRNNVIMNCLQDLAGVNDIGVVKFPFGRTLRQEDLSLVRFFGRLQDSCAKVVECSVTSRWPMRRTKIVPYVCFSNYE